MAQILEFSRALRVEPFSTQSKSADKNKLQADWETLQHALAEIKNSSEIVLQRTPALLEHLDQLDMILDKALDRPTTQWMRAKVADARTVLLKESHEFSTRIEEMVSCAAQLENSVNLKR
ncbi:hypothetical protein [Bradyrhizobium lupini]|uniref:hypothetical protein n=1 Tax=Rhizobium lupini TaxID=136996 RepID=UPI0034C65665